MPNYVTNNLVVTGPKLDVKRFVNAVNKSPTNTFDFQSVHPMPDALVGTTAPTRIQTAEEIAQKWTDYNTRKAEGKLNKYDLDEGKPFGLGITQEQCDALIAEHGCSDWYSWRISNWGTKWDASHATEWDIVDDEDGVASASIFYQTAWSPADAFLKFVSVKYPTLIFRQWAADEGGEFVVDQIFENGSMRVTDFDWDSLSGIKIREALGLWHPEDEDDLVDHSERV